jgi:UDP-GlcNAc:undecaprenyl-phosphate GlcNAc-1-phosphate transferase
VREYALVIAVAAAVTYLLTPLCRRLAVRIGALAQPRDRDVHTIPIPRLGGLAMYAGLVAGMMVAARLPFLSAVFRDHSESRAILVAGGLIVLLGAIDDRWPLDAVTKLAGQVAAVGVMVLLGIQLTFALLPSGDVLSLTSETSVPLTVLLAVLLVNAVNFVDGLDGLAAGVCGIAALATFVYSYQLAVSYGFYRATPSTLIAAVTVGVCLGFLPHNLNPARVFMGDSGSMLLGLLLAASMTSVTGQVNLAGNVGTSTTLPAAIPLLIPLAVLAVPFLDFGLAVVRRTRAGRSPFSPDKLHLHHRLLEIGHSHVRAVLLMYAFAALLAFGGVAVSLAPGRWPLIALTGGISSLALLVAVAIRPPRADAGRPARAPGRAA